MTRLTANIHADELTQSMTAARHNIDNKPPQVYLSNLKRLAVELQKIRDYFGKPIIISSGYRSPRLNKMIGGAETSMHQYCLAADFTIGGVSNWSVFVELKEKYKQLLITIDQLILEYSKSEYSGWIHLGLSQGRPRYQFLTLPDKSLMRRLHAN